MIPETENIIRKVGAIARRPRVSEERLCEYYDPVSP